MPKPQPSAALIEMMAAEQEERPFGIVGEMLNPSPQIFGPAAPAWRPPPPDWAAEEAERAEQERQRQQEQRALILEEELAKIKEDEEIYPAPPAKRRWRS
jgi:hypothetical protein